MCCEGRLRAGVRWNVSENASYLWEGVWAPALLRGSVLKHVMEPVTRPHMSVLTYPSLRIETNTRTLSFSPPTLISPSPLPPPPSPLCPSVRLTYPPRNFVSTHVVLFSLFIVSAGEGITPKRTPLTLQSRTSSSSTVFYLLFPSLLLGIYGCACTRMRVYVCECMRAW